MFKPYLLLILLPNMCLLARGQSDRNWLCGACRIMNFEVDYEISGVDESRTTMGGSYRIDPHGNQKTVEKKFKRSQLHIHEVMENVCSHMDRYGLLISAPAGQTDKVRNYQFVTIKNAFDEDSELVDGSSKIKQRLKHKCDDILEEHEEWFEEFFAKEVTAADADKELCVVKAGYCKLEELTYSLQPPPIRNKKKEENNEVDQENASEDDDDDNDKDEL